MSDQATGEQEALRAIFERNYGLMNEHDLASIPTVFTEDVECQDDAWPETIRGHAGMKRFLGALWRAFPELRFEVLEGPFSAGDGRRAAVRVRVSGTMTGTLEPPGFAPTNTRFATEFGGFYELDGERVRRARVIINMNHAAVQLGAAPAPGTPGERAMVTLQRVQARLMRRRA